MGLFDNAKTVTIDNKPVKTIVTSYGNVLFDAHDYAISLSSNKNYLSLMNNESATLTATVTDRGDVASNESVLFYEGSVYMNPLTDTDNDFTLVYGSAFDITSNGTAVVNGDRMSHSQLLDMTTDSFEISFKATPTVNSNYAVVGNFTTNRGASNSYTGFSIRSDYIEFFGGAYNMPLGVVWANGLDITMKITPSQQQLYIDNMLVGTTTVDLTNKINPANNYLNFYSFDSAMEFRIKNLGVVVNNGGKVWGFGVTNNSGVATCVVNKETSGSFTVLAECKEKTDSVIITAGYPSVTLTSSKNNLTVDENATLTASVVENSVPIANKQVVFFEDDVYANPLTSNDTDFTALYGNGFTVSSSGMSVDSGDRLVHNQLLDMTTDSFEITFKCTPTVDSSYALAGEFTTSNGVSNANTVVKIGDNYIEFFDGGFGVPAGVVWGYELDVKIEVSPSMQKLYINNNLVGTTTVDLTTETNASNNYFNLFSYGTIQEYSIRNLGIIVNGGGKLHGFGVTNVSGLASCTYSSSVTGQFTVSAECYGQVGTVNLVVS